MSERPQNVSVPLSQARGSPDTRMTTSGPVVPPLQVSRNDYQSGMPSLPSNFFYDENWTSEDQLPLTQPRVNVIWPIYPVDFYNRPIGKDIGAGMPVFVRKELHQSLSSKKRLLDGSTQLSDAFVMMTPPIMNEMFYKLAISKKKRTIPEDIMKMWTIAGIASTARSDQTGGSTRHIVVDRIHSTDVCNVWGPVRAGQTLFLVVKYEPLEDNLQYFRGSFDDAIPRQYLPYTTYGKNRERVRYACMIKSMVTNGHECPPSSAIDTEVIHEDGSKELVRGYYFRIGFVIHNSITRDLSDTTPILYSTDLPYAKGLNDIQEMVKHSVQVYVNVGVPLFQ